MSAIKFGESLSKFFVVFPSICGHRTVTVHSVHLNVPSKICNFQINLNIYVHAICYSYSVTPGNHVLKGSKFNGN